ncbi:MAG: S8 family serine peptidase [Verrucomicrobia bacterium]|nr:S8 family serine peptidase [Verrucomicrobiota bacterium]
MSDFTFLEEFATKARFLPFYARESESFPVVSRHRITRELSGADTWQAFDRSHPRLSATQPQLQFVRVVRQSIQLALAAVLCVSTSAAAPHKVRVRDVAEEQSLIARGGKVIADYGSFRLIETKEDFPGGKKREQREDDSDVIELNARRLNTTTAEVKALRKPRSPFFGKQLHLIHFAGPIKPEWRATLESHGVKIVSYIPQNAYLVRGDSAALARLQSWAGVTNIVQWDGDYANDFKIHPAARTTDANGQPQTPDTDTFAIQLVEDAVANPQTLALIEQLKLAPIKRQFALLEFVNVIVRLPADQLVNISSRPDVISIQPYVDPQQRDERQDQIIAGNLSGSAPSGPGYLAWLTGKGFAQSQFEESGFAVDISDSGVDNGTTTPGHFGLYTGGNPFAASRVIYNRVEGTPNVGSTTAGCDGHGTLNAHIIMGYNAAPPGFPHTDSAGYHYGLGVCPFVKLGSSVIFDSDAYTFPNFANLQSKAYHDGARISANSWGATNNTYSVDSQTYDALVRDAQPGGSTFPTAGNQQMVIVFAAGNKGSAANTVGSPGTGKNVITVGASENVQSFAPANGGNSANGSDGCGVTDASANNANDIASFSSRGPCSDGRQKPDLVAPGTHVSGGVGQSNTATSGNGVAIACFKASGVSALPGAGACGTPTIGNANNFFPLGQQFYTVSSGTSHSTPAVAGACALLRQYFINTNLAPPSPAMTKAYLMNSTRYLTGVSANDNLWSPNQGMGELNIGTAFDGTPRVLRDQMPADKFTATGQTRVFTVSVTDTNKPFRATLAWTDAPGSTTGNAFNNDLDMTVTVVGNTYKGNVFTGSFSTTGGSADAKNNVENIFLPAGTAGTVVVTVSAANINSDGVPNEAPSLDQDFALVLYNVSGVAVSGYSMSGESCFPTNNAVDAGETVTVNFQIVNSGTADVSDLTATLLATNGVLLPSGPQNYGTVSAGGASVSRPFTFIADGNCGGSITATLHLQSGATDLGTVTQVIPIGNIVVQTFNFTNATSLTIPSSGAASVYPSIITVSGITGTVTKVTATLRGLSHRFPDDIDTLLVKSGGTNVMLMSDVGGSPDINGVTLTFDDGAAASLPDSTSITTGTWKPTNVDMSSDVMQSNAPAGPFGTTLWALTNGNPNTTWSLYVRDDSNMDSGSLTQGWVLSITTSNVYCCDSALNTADLGVSQAASGSVTSVGGNVTFTLVVTNHGANPSAFVTLSNLLPPGLGFVSATASQGVCSNVGGVVTCSLGLLNANESATVTIGTTALNGGLMTNHVMVGSGTLDPVPANNTAQLAVFVNTPPVISDVANKMIPENADTGTIAFTIGDAETSPGDLTLLVESSNANLVPPGNITLSGSGSNRTVLITPATNQLGDATITLIVSDGLATSSDSFVVSVMPANSMLVLVPVGDHIVVEGATLTFTNMVSSGGSPAGFVLFSLVGAPSGATIDPTNGIFAWTPTESQGPGTNQFFVVATDGGLPGLSATQSFTVIVIETNVAPVLLPIPEQIVVEGDTLMLTNVVTDVDLPANALTFTLFAAPTNAVLNQTDGVFAWTPVEAQGPGTNVITIIVTDDGLPSLSATQSFTVIVLETNEPPTLAAVSNHYVVVGEQITITNLAFDADLPENFLTFSLLNAPTNATIDPTNGLIEWTPLPSQSSSTNNIVVVVADDGVPSLSATQSFTVVVIASNLPPVLGVISNFTLIEGDTLTFTNVVSDADIPANTLLFSLLAAPTNAVLDGTNGVFTWTPLPAQAPSTNVIVVIVTDDGVPVLSATQSFSVLVLQTNHPPVLAAIADRMIHAGTLVRFTNAVTDVNLPPDALSFSLDAGVPPGATVGASDGLFLWATSDADANTTNIITVRVTDNGLPPLSDAMSFMLTVVERPLITSLEFTNQTVQVTWSAVSGQGYQLEYTTNLSQTNWSVVLPDVISNGATAAQTNIFDQVIPQYYRVRVLP